MLKFTQDVKSIAVFCGSHIGNGPSYQLAAETLAHVFTKNNIQTIYGGASVGIMGHFADTVLALGGQITGVIPQTLFDVEIAHSQLSKLIVTPSMTERKATMGKLADAFILMPGGLGSLEEFFEALSWLQLGIHNKPCAIFNVNGYFNKLLDFLDHAVNQGFIKPVHRQCLIVEQDASDLLQQLNTYYERPSHNRL